MSINITSTDSVIRIGGASSAPAAGGLSAFESAQMAGFTGTESEFYTSLSLVVEAQNDNTLPIGATESLEVTPGGEVRELPYSSLPDA